MVSHIFTPGVWKCICVGLLNAVGLGLLVFSSPVIAHQKDGATLLDDIKRSLGRKGPINSLWLQGTASSGVNLATGRPEGLPRALEINILLPDYYLRTETGEISILSYGFAQATLLNRWTPTQPGIQISSNFPPERIVTERLHFARLMIGMIGESKTALTLSLRRAGSQSVSLIGPKGAIGELDLTTGSEPLRVRYRDTVRFAGPQTRSTKGAMPQLPEARLADLSILFEDRRPVDGVKFPFKITRIVNETVLETFQFSSIKINPPLSPRDFEIK